MLVKFNTHSVNQLNAQIKLNELWNANNDEDHPFKLQKVVIAPEAQASRSQSSDLIPMLDRSNISRGTFINDGIKAWNLAPANVKLSSSYAEAKNNIRKYEKTLPI